MPSLTFDQFIAKYNGRGIDYDKYYGHQCVDLYRQYLKEVLGVPQSPPVRGAADIWGTYRKEDFERIPNTPFGLPQKGDIMIWNTRAGGGFGHVAVVTSAQLMWFHALSQNDPMGSLTRINRYSYSNVYGWLRPKKTPPPAGDDVLLNRIREIANGSAGTPKDRISQIRALLRD